jgi:hypothetical protein
MGALQVTYRYSSVHETGAGSCYVDMFLSEEGHSHVQELDIKVTYRLGFFTSSIPDLNSLAVLTIKERLRRVAETSRVNGATNDP